MCVYMCVGMSTPPAGVQEDAVRVRQQVGEAKATGDGRCDEAGRRFEEARRRFEETKMG